MKTCAILVLLAALATPVGAAVIHDEGVNGDLSSNAAAPTALAFALGGNTVIGTTTSGDRDYLTFVIPANHALTGLILHHYSPDNLSFASFNAGATSFVPSGATNASFLSGIHVEGLDLGTNLMPRFVDRAVTTNALASPQLTAGTYSFLIQQTNPIIQEYSLEFIVETIVPTDTKTWGAVKALFR